MDNSASNDPNQPKFPPSLRLKLWLGKFLGYFWVPEGYVQVIFREGRYYEVRGPGMVKYDGWSETLGPRVSTGSKFAEYDFTGLLTRDTVPVHIRFKTLVSYNPRTSSRDIARVLTRMPAENYIRMAEPYFRWAMMDAVNQYDAAQIARSEVLAQIAETVLSKVTEDMKFLGLQPKGRIQILGIELPRTLAERQEQIAQRRASILASAEYHPAELRRALVTEVIESIGRQGTGDSLINFNEMLESYAESRAGNLPPPIIDVESKPSSPPPPPEEKPSARRPRSRL